MVRLYHITDKVDFRLDPRKHPVNNTTMGEALKPGIFLAPHADSWANGYGYWRPWVAEFEVPSGVGIERGYGGEVFVLAEDYDKVSLIRVMAMDAYGREKFQDWGWTETEFGTTFDTEQPLPPGNWHMTPYARFPYDSYQAPDARHSDPAWQARYKARVKKYQRGHPAIYATKKNRCCERCGGAMPNRTHRQRDSKGHLVCDSCKGLNMPEWSTKHSSLSLMAQSEMRRREAEAIVSISRVARLQREAEEESTPRCEKCHERLVFASGLGKGPGEWVHAFPEDADHEAVPPKTGMRRQAHDSGDNAVINHCPFCGSGAVVKSSDGSTSCDYCHNNFTVQVQPSHPNMPQTIDGQPTPPPGMPGDDPANPAEISGPDDPTVAEDSDGVATESLGDADPTKSNGPVQPGQPPSKQPNPFAKADPSTNPGKGQDGTPAKPGDKPDDGKKKSLPPWMKKKTMRTATGAALAAEDYVAHLALAFADDRTAVLDSVRLNRVAVQHMAEDAKRCTCGALDYDGCFCGLSWSEWVADRKAKDKPLGRLPKGEDPKKPPHTGSKRVTCPRCHGPGEVDTGKREHETNAPITVTCPRCHGDGELDADDPDNFDLRQPPAHEGSMRPFLREAASGLTKHRVKATEVQVGDYLDSSGKVRVHNTHTRNDTVMLAWRLKGSKAPGVRDHHIDETVSVWRR